MAEASLIAAVAHRGAHIRRQSGRGRFLDHLLVPPLQRAVALQEMDDIPRGVGEDLDLDVTRRREKALDDDPAVAESRLRLAAGGGQRLVEAERPVDAPHAAAAAARDRLDQHRVADLVGLLAEKLRLLPLAVIAGQDRDAEPRRQRLRFGFQAHCPDRLGRRADENKAGRGAGFGKGGVLGEEAVARMDCRGVRLLGGGEDADRREVAFRSRAGADHDQLVGLPRMRPGEIRLGGDGDRPDAHVPRGADDPAGDLAAIGDEERGDHRALVVPGGERRKATSVSGVSRRRR